MLSKATITIENKRDGTIVVNTDYESSLEDAKKMRKLPDTHLIAVAMQEMIKRFINVAKRRQPKGK